MLSNGCQKSKTWTATYTGACGTQATPVEVTYTWTEAATPAISLSNTSQPDNHDFGCSTPAVPTFIVADACNPDATATVSEGDVLSNGCQT